MQAPATNIEDRHLDAELGRAPLPGDPKTVAEAIQLFMDSKRGEDLSENTLYKHKLTLDRLQVFCEAEGVLYLKDVTLAHLTTWRSQWTFDSPLASQAQQPRAGEVLFQILPECWPHSRESGGATLRHSSQGG